MLNSFKQGGCSFISKNEKQAALLLALTMLCYASNHVIGRAVHDVLPPLGLSFWRWVFGAAILLPFVLPGLKQVVPRYCQHWKLFSLLGLLITGSTSLVLVGLNFTTATNTSLINASQPTITALLCWLFLKDRLSIWQWCAAWRGHVAGAQATVRSNEFDPTGRVAVPCRAEFIRPGPARDSGRMDSTLQGR